MKSPVTTTLLADAARDAAAEASARLKKRQTAIRERRDFLLSSQEDTDVPFELTPSSTLHPLTWKQAEAYVALSQDGFVDFKKPPLADPAKDYMHVFSTQGLAGLTLAWRLPVSEWNKWLLGSSLEDALGQLCQKNKQCDRDIYDDAGDFVMRRWERLPSNHIVLGPNPPEQWLLDALTVAAVCHLRLEQAPLPAVSSTILAIPPDRLQASVLLDTGGLALPFGASNEKGKLHGRNLYGIALKRALLIERQRRS